MPVSVNQQPSIGECFVKLYAQSTPGAAETAVGTATCAADGLVPLTTWIGDGLDNNRRDKGITKVVVNWKAEYTNALPMPDRPTSPFFISNTPAQIGISGGSFIINYDG